MTTAIEGALKSFLKVDPSITQNQINACLTILRGEGDLSENRSVSQVVLSREEVAQMMGISPKRVDDFSRGGYLKRVYFPGCVRASGILRSSVDSLIKSGVR